MNDVYSEITTLKEKAYAQANEIGEFARKTSRNTYTSIESGLNEAIKHISGSSSAYVYAPRMSAGTWNTKNSEIISKVKNNKQIFVGCYKDSYDINGRKMFVSGHAFAIVGYDNSTDQFILRNPWGSGGSSYVGQFKASWSQLYSVKALVAYT